MTISLATRGAPHYRSFWPAVNHPASAKRRRYKNRQENKFSEHRQILFGAVLKVSGESFDLCWTCASQLDLDFPIGGQSRFARKNKRLCCILIDHDNALLQYFSRASYIDAAHIGCPRRETSAVTNWLV